MGNTCLIIDDERNNVSNLDSLLRLNCPTISILGSANSADEGKRKIEQLKPDLIFLDIQMPKKNGFEMLREIDDLLSEVIFVTAFDEYAIHAIKFSAVDYLLKPINVKELKDAVSRATKRISEKQQNYTLKNLIELINKEKNANEHRIALPMLKEIRLVNTGQIIRCESCNNYSTFYLQNGESILVCRPIYEYERLLADYGFIRCHQSHLINQTYIKSWIKETGGWFLMEDGKQVPISKTKKDGLKALLRI